MTITAIILMALFGALLVIVLLNLLMSDHHLSEAIIRAVLCLSLITAIMGLWLVEKGRL